MDDGDSVDYDPKAKGVGEGILSGFTHLTLSPPPDFELKWYIDPKG